MRQRIVTLFLIFLDVAIITISPILALNLRFDGVVQEKYFMVLQSYLPVIIVVYLGAFYLFGLYRRMWRYASIHELIAIIMSVSISSLIIFGMAIFSGLDSPRTVYLMSWFFNIIFIGGSRLSLRVYYYFRNRTQNPSEQVLIVGAGDAGAMIARELRQRYYDTKYLLGFVDDDPAKRNKLLFGTKVIGTQQDIPEIAAKYHVSEIIIAMPSVRGRALRDIIERCQQIGCSVKILPGMYEIIDGKVTVQQLRNVDLEDLLGREPIRLDIPAIAGYLQGKRVLVTGAGGSIGSELCRQIVQMNPSCILLLGKGENSVYEIEQELRRKVPNIHLEPIIADVRDTARINEVFRNYRPEVVFHAAAHKHVPLMERQPVEAVKNNIFGTKTVAEAALKYDTEIFIMVSTDKAVNPTSVMGATKRVAELIVQSLNGMGTTKYAAVRFGNVLGSRGSVIPLFKKQIAAGGPVTVTHPDMKRYFMTIPEATQLVMQAGALAQGGEVFVLDMGEPVKIVDMALDLIRLSGLEPDKDISIVFTGLRPGEKLFEELLTAEEGTFSTKHEKIYQANLRQVESKRLEKYLYQLAKMQDATEIIKILDELIPTYPISRKQAKVVTGKVEFLKPNSITNSSDAIQVSH